MPSPRLTVLDTADIPAPSPYGTDHYDATTLTPGQASGLACVVCEWPGGDEGLIPVGYAASNGEPAGQVFACADCCGVNVNAAEILPEGRHPARTRRGPR
jgi:hypothetical protein